MIRLSFRIAGRGLPVVLAAAMLAGGPGAGAIETRAKQAYLIDVQTGSVRFVGVIDV